MLSVLIVLLCIGLNHLQASTPGCIFPKEIPIEWRNPHVNTQIDRSLLSSVVADIFAERGQSGIAKAAQCLSIVLTRNKSSLLSSRERGYSVTPVLQAMHQYLETKEEDYNHSDFPMHEITRLLPTRADVLYVTGLWQQETDAVRHNRLLVAKYCLARQNLLELGVMTSGHVIMAKAASAIKEQLGELASVDLRKVNLRAWKLGNIPHIEIEKQDASAFRLPQVEQVVNRVTELPGVQAEQPVLFQPGVQAEQPVLFQPVGQEVQPVLPQGQQVPSCSAAQLVQHPHVSSREKSIGRLTIAMPDGDSQSVKTQIVEARRFCYAKTLPGLPGCLGYDGSLHHAATSVVFDLQSLGAQTFVISPYIMQKVFFVESAIKNGNLEEYKALREGMCANGLRDLLSVTDQQNISNDKGRELLKRLVIFSYFALTAERGYCSDLEIEKAQHLRDSVIIPSHLGLTQFLYLNREILISLECSYPPPVRHPMLIGGGFLFDDAVCVRDEEPCAALKGRNLLAPFYRNVLNQRGKRNILRDICQKNYGFFRYQLASLLILRHATANHPVAQLMCDMAECVLLESIALDNFVDHEYGSISALAEIVNKNIELFQMIDEYQGVDTSTIRDLTNIFLMECDESGRCVMEERSDYVVVSEKFSDEKGSGYWPVNAWVKKIPKKLWFVLRERPFGFADNPVYQRFHKEIDHFRKTANKDQYYDNEEEYKIFLEVSKKLARVFRGSAPLLYQAIAIASERAEIPVGLFNCEVIAKAVQDFVSEYDPKDRYKGYKTVSSDGGTLPFSRKTWREWMTEFRINPLDIACRLAGGEYDYRRYADFVQPGVVLDKDVLLAITKHFENSKMPRVGQLVDGACVKALRKAITRAGDAFIVYVDEVQGATRMRLHELEDEERDVRQAHGMWTEPDGTATPAEILAYITGMLLKEGAFQPDKKAGVIYHKYFADAKKIGTPMYRKYCPMITMPIAQKIQEIADERVCLMKQDALCQRKRVMRVVWDYNASDVDLYPVNWCVMWMRLFNDATGVRFCDGNTTEAAVIKSILEQHEHGGRLFDVD